MLKSDPNVRPPCFLKCLQFNRFSFVYTGLILFLLKKKKSKSNGVKLRLHFCHDFIKYGFALLWCFTQYFLTVFYRFWTCLVFAYISVDVGIYVQSYISTFYCSSEPAIPVRYTDLVLMIINSYIILLICQKMSTSTWWLEIGSSKFWWGFYLLETALLNVHFGVLVFVLLDLAENCETQWYLLSFWIHITFTSFCQSRQQTLVIWDCNNFITKLILDILNVDKIASTIKCMSEWSFILPQQ